MTRQHWTQLYPDRVKRGTEASGAKLTPEEIEEIVYLYTSCGSPQTYLARRYKVSRATVWRHIKTSRGAKV